MRFQTLNEGRLFFAILTVLTIVGAVLGWWPLVAIGILGLLFCINFFRDPERAVPEGDDIVVSAADGVVAVITEMEEGEYLKTRCRCVGVFLSVFDVHVNRAPIAGEVVHRNHFPGTYPGPYLDARHPDCVKFNEALTWAFKGTKATLVVRQITGAIARRIVPWSMLGDRVEKGFRFGMIRFGSYTEVYLPLDAEVAVKVGDRVKGAETILARLK